MGGGGSAGQDVLISMLPLSTRSNARAPPIPANSKHSPVLRIQVRLLEPPPQILRLGHCPIRDVLFRYTHASLAQCAIILDVLVCQWMLFLCGSKDRARSMSRVEICHVRIDILARLNHKAATPWQVCLLLRGRLQHAEECRGTTTAASGPALLRVQYHKGPRAIPPGQTIMLMGCISIIA